MQTKTKNCRRRKRLGDTQRQGRKVKIKTTNTRDKEWKRSRVQRERTDKRSIAEEYKSRRKVEKNRRRAK
jgi:hypothetical protein